MESLIAQKREEHRIHIRKQKTQKIFMEKRLKYIDKSSFKEVQVKDTFDTFSNISTEYSDALLSIIQKLL